MSAHVVVIDTRARRAQIKVQPNTYLSDVLSEACKRFDVDPHQYALKSGNKAIDLSQPFRLSGLIGGTKLELVQESRSPSPVSVALQEEGGNRDIERFLSSTTLWQILRKFEVNDTKRNLTGRSYPNAKAGSGRLCYEQPVMHIMGRDLVTFDDLQKTLGSLGIKHGSTLIRLKFLKTETPMEEAKARIDDYFKSIEPKEGESNNAGDLAPATSTTQFSTPADEEETHLNGSLLEEDAQPADGQVPASATSDETTTGPTHRRISVYAPPSSSTPQAARHNVTPEDFEPSIAQAKAHQARLNKNVHNRRLPSDAEIAAQEQALKEKLSQIKEVEIKIRFPDQTTIVGTFTDDETVAELAHFVRSVLISPHEPFELTWRGDKGIQHLPQDHPNKKLIRDVGLKGKMLMNFQWDEVASLEARSGQLLKEEYVNKAQQIPIPIAFQGVETEMPDVPAGKGDEKEKEKGDKKGLPRWLKLPGKK